MVIGWLRQTVAKVTKYRMTTSEITEKLIDIRGNMGGLVGHLATILW